ncbi:SDR family NAD(P)-dependent oxidoreductase [Jatrophihabitans sp. DSM 45814]
MDIPSPMDLSGRVAIVTGAGSPAGIGFATAELLGQLGASLVLAATTERVHDRVADLANHQVPVSGLVGDLSRPAAATALVEHALQRFGRLDILVNNAGMISQSDPDFQDGSIDSIDLNSWHASLARNLDTAFLVSKSALPAMREQGWGRIVMISSVTGPVMAMRADVSYATAKAGMIGLTRALAVDLAEHNITVNAVAPGWIATASQTVHEQAQGLSTPSGRSARPGEVAFVAASLCCPGASYLTGQCIVVDGGNSIAEERSS